MQNAFNSRSRPGEPTRRYAHCRCGPAAFFGRDVSKKRKRLIYLKHVEPIAARLNPDGIYLKPDFAAKLRRSRSGSLVRPPGAPQGAAGKWQQPFRRFAIKSYLHFLKLEDQSGFINQLMRLGLPK